MKLIDTDIFIDFSRGRKEAIDCLEALEKRGDLNISQVTEMEVVIGCRNAKELTQAEELFSRFKMWPIREAYSQLGSELLKTHYHRRGVGILDCLIAATAIKEHLILVSRNQKHYQAIPGLILEIPY